MSILELDRLECGYDETLLGPVDLVVEGGRFVLLEGPNGIGKSTFLKTLVGLVPPLGGCYEWSVDDASIRYVPQVQGIDPILPATVEDVVATGSQRGTSLASMAVTSDEETLVKALDKVDMLQRRTALFRELSEGQKQLVLLARAISGRSEVLVLDEPTASMDPDREARAIDLLVRESRERDLTVVLVAHGNRHARAAADAVLEIDADRNIGWKSTD